MATPVPPVQFTPPPVTEKFVGKALIVTVVLVLALQPPAFETE